MFGWVQVLKLQNGPRKVKEIIKDVRRAEGVMEQERGGGATLRREGTTTTVKQGDPLFSSLLTTVDCRSGGSHAERLLYSKERGMGPHYPVKDNPI